MGNISILEKYIPELITSLLYASAISAMLSQSMNISHSSSGYTIIVNTFLLISVVFADWHNRIYVPLKFPLQDQIQRKKRFFQYSKLFIEILSMVLLVLFYSHFVKSNYQTEEFVNIYSLFACYLVTCGVWNIIILKIMKRIKFVSLLKSLFQGNTFELEHLKEYTEDFITKYEEKEKKLEIEFDNARKKNGFKDGLKKVKKGGRKLIPQINLARALAQYIANYILWINFWVASMILLLAFNFHEHLFFFNNLYKMLKIPLNLETFQIALLLIVSVVLISIVFFIQLNSVYNKRLFGNLLILFLLIFYSIFSVQILIYILVVQQIFIGFAIQVITDGIKSVELEYGDN